MDSMLLYLHALKRHPFRCYVYQNAAQSVSNGTQIHLDTILKDPNNNFTVGSSWAYTVPVDGYYLIIAQVSYASNTANNTISCEIDYTDFVYGNALTYFGEAYPGSFGGTSNNTSARATGIFPLKATTTVTLKAQTGSTWNTGTGAGTTFMQIQMLSLR